VDVTEHSNGLTFSAIQSPWGVAEALVLSSVAMVEILRVANLRLGMGLEEKLQGLAQRVSKMAKRLPAE
jgi:hypothetical protein